MGQGNGPTVAIFAGMFVGGLICIQAAANYLGSDARAVRDCEATHWVCESTVSARPQLESIERSRPRFAGDAKACTEQAGFERALHRAMFECGMSPRAEEGSCTEVKTLCDLTEAG